MSTIQVALYARVSSEQQSEAGTIESQIADLHARIAKQGLVLSPELAFVDNGYSGATLIRPALERLRDVTAAGGIDRLYVHCPDRLARNYAHQVLLTSRVPACWSGGDIPQSRSGANARRSAPVASARDDRRVRAG